MAIKMELRLKVKGLDIYIPPLTGKPWPAACCLCVVCMCCPFVRSYSGLGQYSKMGIIVAILIARWMSPNQQCQHKLRSNVVHAHLIWW